VKLLIIEDDPAIARGLIRLLKQDHEVQWAPDIAEAKTLVLRTVFDGILSDVMMPAGSGADFHRWLVVHHPHLLPRMAFMTGGMASEMSGYVRGTGAPVLEKPFLLGPLNDVLRGFSKTQEA